MGVGFEVSKAKTRPSSYFFLLLVDSVAISATSAAPCMTVCHKTPFCVYHGLNL